VFEVPADGETEAAIVEVVFHNLALPSGVVVHIPPTELPGHPAQGPRPAWKT
jgi:hypothetical protein